jgi:sulfotransferase family protein
MSAARAPVIILGVRRSGTTLLRVILDRSSELAIPDESYVVPQIAQRHRGPVDPAAFVDDLRRLPRFRELGIDPDDVAPRLRPGITPGEAVGAVFETYAADRGKQRWGDKTPLYMQYLPMLERLFPEARFVHLVRDGRDAAISFLAMPEGIVTRTWAHPTDAAGFACQWRTEIEAAQALGRRVGPGRHLEVRYERLVAEPEPTVREICTFVELPFEPGMLDYAGTVDLTGKPHQQRLTQPPTTGVRDWRTEMTPADVAAFEEVAGDVLARLGYEVARSRPTRRGRARLVTYRLRLGAFNAVAAASQRSPLWRRRHPPVTAA